MLTLTRKENERIHIGDHITVTVVRVGQTVKLGIKAPPGVVVHRKEIADLIRLSRELEIARLNEEIE